jgi:hypothetical protein
LTGVFGDVFKSSEPQITNVRIARDRATYSATLNVRGEPLGDPSDQGVVWEDGRWREAAVDPC